MQLIADLQLHSKYSRAVSPEMVIPKMYEWNLKKGIGLLATGDWTHPLWVRELKSYLEEQGNGLLKLKPEIRQKLVDLSFAEKVAHNDPLFLLSGEVSCIYSHNGKLRRNHILMFAPTFEIVDKINAALTKRGCNLSSDGRPILGLSSQDVCELAWSISEEVLLIPAHCLLPSEQILTNGFHPKPIKDIQVGEQVFTHKGRFKKVTEIKKRVYTGEIMTIKPWYFRPGLATTPEHPYYAIKTLKKCPSTGDICRPSRSHLALCKRKPCLEYKPEWVLSKNLEVGDVLVYPRSKQRDSFKHIYLSETTSGERISTIEVIAGGTRGRNLRDKVEITPELGRLLGYYLAEGSTDGYNAFSFCFSQTEKEFVDDLKQLMESVFGLTKPRIYHRPQTQSTEITYFSKILAQWFASICYLPKAARRAINKFIPGFLFSSNEHVQAEVLRGWYRGDKGYTSSRTLMNQMKAICLNLEIIPSIIIDTKQAHLKRGKHIYKTRIIRANHDSYAFSNFAFFKDIFDLKREIRQSQTKIDRRHGWIDENNVYLPIKEIKKEPYKGNVYNLEVEQDHSYVAEFAAVHNCWTPWFSVFGSMSGYDSLAECFGQFASRIYSIETGLSSDPAMNWRIRELDTRTVISCSDSHFGPKLMREATIFEVPAGSNLSFGAISSALQNYSRDKTQPHIAATIEFYPEEGKYHFSGHRACNTRFSPQEIKAKGKICPVCGKPMTIGVLNRVEDLAGRSEAELKLYKKQLGNLPISATYSEAFSNRAPYIMLVPLMEILAESVGVQSYSTKVREQFDILVKAFGGEFSVLVRTPKEEIVRVGGAKIADGIDRVRRGEITILPGYDGVFGTVKVFAEGEEIKEEVNSKEQMSLF